MTKENKDCCAQEQISKEGKLAGESYHCFLEHFQ